MGRFGGMLVLVFAMLARASQACSCVAIDHPCQRLRSDVAFVGKVVETVAVKAARGEIADAASFSMRFAVEESLKGDLGREAVVLTGTGGGDCGTPLHPGQRFLIFAYKSKDGTLWTGQCQGNEELNGDANDGQLLETYRALVKKDTGMIFGNVSYEKEIWWGGRTSRVLQPSPGTILRAESGNFSAVTKALQDGSYELVGLPNGKYTVVPETGSGLDFDHEFDDSDEADVRNGQCAKISFRLEPVTRIRGHITRPPGIEAKAIDVLAIPALGTETDRLSSRPSSTDEHDRFDVWPLPAGDYYVGVNIDSSPTPQSPFPPTYYPGVANPKAATIVHLDEGEIKELELTLPEVAHPRFVHLTAIGLDGKPLRRIHVEFEDLHLDRAASYVNVDLDSRGSGILNVYAGYSYQLLGSHRVDYANDWCAKPVVIPAGTKPIELRLVMDHEETKCGSGLAIP